VRSGPDKIALSRFELLVRWACFHRDGLSSGILSFRILLLKGLILRFLGRVSAFAYFACQQILSRIGRLLDNPEKYSDLSCDLSELNEAGHSHLLSSHCCEAHREIVSGDRTKSGSMRSTP